MRTAILVLALRTTALAAVPTAVADHCQAMPAEEEVPCRVDAVGASLQGDAVDALCAASSSGCTTWKQIWGPFECEVVCWQHEP